MLTLSSTTDKVQCTTSNAASIDYVTTYVIKDNATPPVVDVDNKSGTLTSTGTTDISGSPADSSHRWAIESIELTNRDASLAGTVQLDHVKAGTAKRLTNVVTLQVGEKLVRDKDGVWFHYDVNMNLITAVAAPMTVSLLTSGSGATYTTKAGCRAILVEAIAGGGAGGGAATAASSGAAGAGGGSGGFTRKLISPPAATYTYTIGAGGTAGATGNNPGNNGADTTFGSLTAKGGTGGAGMAAGTTGISMGGAGGIAGSGGDINAPGAQGESSQILSASVARAGAGAPSELAGSGASGRTTQGTGNSATANTGGGGGGGVVVSAGAAVAGGAGGSGLVVVTEYY